MEYNHLIYKFLWSDKKPRITHKKIIQDCAQGGLKLVDLRAKDLAMKASFVTKAIQNPNSPIYYDLPIKDERMWQCNLNFLDFKDNNLLSFSE